MLIVHLFKILNLRKLWNFHTALHSIRRVFSHTYDLPYSQFPFLRSCDISLESFWTIFHTMKLASLPPIGHFGISTQHFIRIHTLFRIPTNSHFPISPGEFFFSTLILWYSFRDSLDHSFTLYSSRLPSHPQHPRDHLLKIFS